MKKLLIGFILLLLVATTGKAAEIPLKWNPNTESNLAGYKVHFGGAYREYIETIDVGNVTSYTIEDLSAGIYHITLTAYDSAGNESRWTYEIIEDLKISRVTGLEILPTP
jgi:uncharacterized protein YxeA